MSELDIIIPIYKEGKNIRLLLDQFQKVSSYNCYDVDKILLNREKF